ncbi:hypothetical protein MACJ_001783 [Theileria orientalis]|uniref:Uncharacterized protein n=1 Tax=Theileria orientalis TaxID=68886 RepID=A0A976M521_THEOR|nr:hypothetical protein MACJ_001783 [Theileria orientalis]
MGFISTQEPILVLLNERPTHGDFSTTHGYYYQDREKTRGDTFTQYTFNPVNGCNLMGKLTSVPDKELGFNYCVEEQMVRIRETWEQITRSMMIKDSGSPATDLNTKDCKPPVGCEKTVDNCFNSKPEDELGKDSSDPGSQKRSTNHEKENDSQKMGLSGPTQIPDPSSSLLNDSQVSDEGGVPKVGEEILPAPKPPVFKGHPYIKVYTLDNNVAKANDPTKVNVKNPSQHEFFYMFKEGVECVEVRFRNKTLWIHDSNAHGNNYPCKISYNDGFDVLYLYMTGTWFYYYLYKNGSWTLYKTNLIGRPKTFTQPAYKQIIYELESPTADEDPDLPRGTEVSKDTDFTFMFYKNIRDGSVKSDYRVFEHYHTLIFYFEKGTKCIRVHYKDVEIWRHSVSEYQTNYPKYVDYNKIRNRIEIIFNSEWYYGYLLNSATKKWELKSTRLVMKPGALRDMLKGVFNVNLTVSPSTISVISGMSIRTIRFFLSFASGFRSGLKTLIDKLYYSDMYWETLPAIIINPDHLCKLFDLIKGTSLAFAEARLHNFIAKPELVLHMLKELKNVGFNVEELLKTLLVNPDKLNTLLAKLRDFGYALNLTQFMNLGKNSEILAYLNLSPIDVKVVGSDGAAVGILPGPDGELKPPGGAASPGPCSEAAEGGTNDKGTETGPESSTTQTVAGGTGSSGSDSEPSKNATSTSEGGEGFLQKAAEFIEKHKTEISAGSGTFVSVGVVGTLVQQLQPLPH